MKEWAEYKPESLNSELAVVTLWDFGLSSFKGGEYILHVTRMFTDHQWSEGWTMADVVAVHQHGYSPFHI